MNDAEIVKQLGLEAAAEAIQSRAVSQVRDIVVLRLGGIIETAMTEEQLDEFNRLKEQSPADVWVWLNSEFTEVDVMYDEVLNDYLISLSSRSY